jgi:hypothetical protein
MYGPPGGRPGDATVERAMGDAPWSAEHLPDWGKLYARFRAAGSPPCLALEAIMIYWTAIKHGTDGSGPAADSMHGAPWWIWDSVASALLLAIQGGTIEHKGVPYQVPPGKFAVAFGFQALGSGKTSAFATAMEPLFWERACLAVAEVLRAAAGAISEPAAIKQVSSRWRLNQRKLKEVWAEKGDWAKDFVRRSNGPAPSASE